MLDIARERDIHPEHLYHAAAIVAISLDNSITDYQPEHDAVVKDLLDGCEDHVDTGADT